MVLHGLKRIFQKPSPDLSSSERTTQLRSKTIYSGTVNLSTSLATPGSNRYKTYNGPFEVVNSSLVASASYSDLLDITKGKVLLDKLPLTNSSSQYYEKNFGNGEIYVGNYQEFNGSFFTNTGPTGCYNSVLVHDMSVTGFTGPGSYTGNSIGNTGPSGMYNSDINIFVDPKHCYYSDPCASSASYMKFVDINFKGPTGTTGVTGSSKYYAQNIINSDQYNGFRFPMSNFTLLTCKQHNLSQTEGPIFCPTGPIEPPSPSSARFVVSDKTLGSDSDPFTFKPSLSNFVVSDKTLGSGPFTFKPSLSNFFVSDKTFGSGPFTFKAPQSNSSGTFTYYSSNDSVSIISKPHLNTITIVGAGTSTITAVQAPFDKYSSGSISTLFDVTPATFTAYWHYTNDGGATHTDITSSQQIPYDDSTYIISLKKIIPANATHSTPSGTQSATNVHDTAQITVTGSGNFMGSLTSPSITIIPAT